jgi:hypothetical protein
MKMWQSLAGIVINYSSIRGSSDVAYAWINQNKKNMKWLMKKAEPKVEPIIELWDTYGSNMFKDSLCVFPIGIA